LLDEVEKQNANLQAGRAKPSVFDNYTIDRVIKVYSDQAEDLWLYEGRLSRWKAHATSPTRRKPSRGREEQHVVLALVIAFLVIMLLELEERFP
jgi:hypothetical protein